MLKPARRRVRQRENEMETGGMKERPRECRKCRGKEKRGEMSI